MEDKKVRVIRKIATALTVLACAAVATTPAAGQAAEGIRVLAGQFGTLGDRRKLDIAAPLQALCGSSSMSCSAFCSETSFGRYRVGRKAICRVTYSCPDASVQATEAAKEEVIALRCEEEDDGGQDVAAPPAAEPQPPAYQPPRG